MQQPDVRRQAVGLVASPLFPRNRTVARSRP